MQSKELLFAKIVILFTVIFLNLAETCDENQTRLGCKISNGNQCICGIGCYSEYRYNSKEECRKVLKGRRYDICAENPCLNEGSCSQTSAEPGYRCHCEGTGFYGSRCEHDCLSATRQGRKFPYECVVI